MRIAGVAAILALLAAPALGAGGNNFRWTHEKQAEAVAFVTGQAICYFIQNNGALTSGGT